MFNISTRETISTRIENQHDAKDTVKIFAHSNKQRNGSHITPYKNTTYSLIKVPRLALVREIYFHRKSLFFCFLSSLPSPCNCTHRYCISCDLTISHKKIIVSSLSPQVTKHFLNTTLNTSRMYLFFIIQAEFVRSVHIMNKPRFLRMGRNENVRYKQNKTVLLFQCKTESGVEVALKQTAERQACALVQEFQTSTISLLSPLDNPVLMNYILLYRIIPILKHSSAGNQGKVQK